MNKLYKVIIWEMDSWSGQSIDDVIRGLSYSEAVFEANKVNSKNTEKVVPDWYLYAEVEEE